MWREKIVSDQLEYSMIKTDILIFSDVVSHINAQF
jgi:hypothetical protein